MRATVPRSRIKSLRYVEASKLKPDPRNWRKHPKAQRNALSAILDRIGWAGAVIARETPRGLVLVDGHLRADLDPKAKIPTLIVDLDERESGEVIATLDPLSAMAQANKSALDSLLLGISADSGKGIISLLESMHGARLGLESGEPDAVPELPAKPISKLGDLWLLGKHRLMCGDSTDEASVSRLLGGAKPNLMVTDPPYGVEYDAGWRAGTVHPLKPCTKEKAGKIAGDDQGADWVDAYALFRGAVAYVWHPDTSAYVFASGLKKSCLEIKAQIIWAKNKQVISRGHYHSKHEPCFYAVRKGKTADWIGGRKQATVWEIDYVRDPESKHPTQKPIECMERPIRNHEGEVYDPFVGSGTTLIAAERQGRTCYAMEVSPACVDMAMKRWENYTGQKAVKCIK